MSVEMINLYSDTQTLPTEAMYDAMRAAPLGDDQQALDPTVNRLEALAAKMLGKEAAVLVASGMMGNLCGLMSQAGHGDEALMDPEAHVWWYEGGACFSIAGVTPRPIASHDGLLDPAEVRAAIRPRNLHFPTPKLLWLENTFCQPVFFRGFLQRWMKRRLEANPVGWLEQRSWSGRLRKSRS